MGCGSSKARADADADLDTSMGVVPAARAPVPADVDVSIAVSTGTRAPNTRKPSPHAPSSFPAPPKPPPGEHISSGSKSKHQSKHQSKSKRKSKKDAKKAKTDKKHKKHKTHRASSAHAAGAGETKDDEAEDDAGASSSSDDDNDSDYGDGPWTDPDFPADATSLAIDPANMPPKWSSYVWRRAADIFGRADYSVFDGISPSDVKQGALGDCYFLGALSCLAEHADRARALFVTQHVTRNGRYKLRFFVDGKQQVVAVDDWFPCVSATGPPAFSNARGAELWVMLLEKAWAKAHGCYERIIGGNPGDALEDLTGAPNTTVALRGENLPADGLDVDAAWRQLIAAEEARKVITASMPDHPDRDVEADVGLVEGHAYSVLDVREIDGGRTRLVHCRNPWGRREWTGDWSDGSDKWTEAHKRELGHNEADDGAFWIAFDDMVQYFEAYTVLDYRDGWSHASADCPLSNGVAGRAVFTVTVPVATRAFLSLLQPDKRQQPEGYEYGGCRVEVLQLKPELEHLHSSTAKVSRTVHSELDLPAGELLVVAYGTFPEGSRDCGFQVYSEHKVRISPAHGSHDGVDAMLTDAYTAAALHHGSDIELGDRAVAGITAKCWKYGAGLCLVYSNRSDGYALNEAVDFEADNAVLSAPDGARGSMHVDVALEPGHTRLVRVELDTIGHSYSISYSRSFSVQRLVTSDSLGALRAETKIKGSLKERGGNAGVTQRKYQYESGVCLLYENAADSGVRLEETLKLTLKGAEVVVLGGGAGAGGGADGVTTVTVDLSPGESEFIVVRATGGAFSMGQKSSIRVTPV